MFFDFKSIMQKELWYCCPLFSKSFHSFLSIKNILITSFPLHQSFFFFFKKTSMHILILFFFFALEFIDTIVLINQVSLGRTGVANRQITKLTCLLMNPIFLIYFSLKNAFAFYIASE